MVPEQKKPLEEYQVALADIRIQNEMYALAREPLGKMFPRTCCCFKRKTEPRAEELAGDKYQEVRDMCVKKEAADITEVVKGDLLRRYATKLGDKLGADQEGEADAGDKYRDRVWLRQFDLEIYHARQMEKLQVAVREGRQQ